MDSCGRLWISHPSSGRVCCYEAGMGYVGGVVLEVVVPRAAGSPVDCVWGGKRLQDLVIVTEEKGVLVVPGESLLLGVEGAKAAAS